MLRDNITVDYDICQWKHVRGRNLLEPGEVLNHHRCSYLDLVESFEISSKMLSCDQAS